MFATAALVSLAALPSLGEERVELWTEDVLHLVEAMERMHPDLYFGVSREEFGAAVDGLLGRLAKLSDDEVAVEVMRLVALVARGGRDGHTAAFSSAFHVLPLQLYAFDDGWFVVEADAPRADLVGARLVAVGGKPIEEVARAVAPLVTRDNDSNLREKLPFYLSMTEVLRALGFAGKDGSAALAFRARDGAQVEATLDGLPIGQVLAAHGGPPHLLPERAGLRGLRDRGRSWWMEVVPEPRALYVQYNAVRAGDEEGELVGDFGARIARAFDEHGLERVVLDLRSNGGGDNTTFGPLIQALKGHAGIDREGALFALIGRTTFSAAGNFVTVLERDTHATLVGEPTGGAPNQYGDAKPVVLAHHPELQVFVSTRYHAFGGKGDARLTHEPKIAVPLRAADYFAGRDAALEAALGAR
jgi:hypothetical protein